MKLRTFGYLQLKLPSFLPRRPLDNFVVNRFLWNSNFHVVQSLPTLSDISIIIWTTQKNIFCTAAGGQFLWNEFVGSLDPDIVACLLNSLFTEDTGTLISTPDLPVGQLFMNLCSEKILDVLGCIIYVVFHEKVQCEFLNASIFFQESFNLGKKSFRWKFSSQNVVGTPSTSSVRIFTQSPNM